MSSGSWNPITVFSITLLLLYWFLVSVLVCFAFRLELLLCILNLVAHTILRKISNEPFPVTCRGHFVLKLRQWTIF